MIRLVARAIAACTTAGEETGERAGVVLTDPEHLQAVLLGENAVANDVVDPARRRIGAAGVDVGEREDTEFHERPYASQAAEARRPPRPR